MNGHERYDSVIVNLSEARVIFCTLVCVFTYCYSGKTFALALVQPLNAPCTSRSGDRELGLCRVRAKPRRDSLIIPVRSIIRGALLAKDCKHPGEFTVVDTLDTDIFLRLITLFPDRDIAKID
jgi:hypothetical protein